MIKRILAVVAISLLLVSPCFADWQEDIEVLKAEAKPCVLYSITENQALYGTSIQLIGYKDFELNGIHSPDKDMVALGLAYEVTSLDKYVDMPLAKYFVLTLGGYVGSRDFTSEERSSDWGLLLTLIKASF